MNSISDTFEYKNICKLAVENYEIFSTFKQKPSYKEILEHVSYEDGLKYLNYIKKYSDIIYKKIKTDFISNDEIGSPVKYEYPDIGNISPTTLRYVKTLVDFTKIFGNFNNKKIIEIGCGYGGQCLILNKMFNNIDYTIIDLDEPSALTKKYLNEHNINIKILPIDEVDNNIEEYDLVISTYAYSEICKDLQVSYYNNIIEKCKHGYFILNFISDAFNINSLTKNELINLFNKKINFIDEYPKTHPNNIVMYF